MPTVATIAVYAAAAVAEIAGCFAFWVWLRQGASAWWLAPGIVALVVFAWLLTFAPADYAGRAYAAYGGIYVAASLGWLAVVERRMPDSWDMIGSAIVLAGAAVILFAPRSAA